MRNVVFSCIGKKKVNIQDSAGVLRKSGNGQGSGKGTRKRCQLKRHYQERDQTESVAEKRPLNESVPQQKRHGQ